MKTPTIEELAKAAYEAAAKRYPDIALSWEHYSNLKPDRKAIDLVAVEAIVDHLFASVEGMPSEPSCFAAYNSSSGHGDGLVAVRNIMLTAHLAIVAEKEKELTNMAKQVANELTRAQKAEAELFWANAKLAAVSALPEKWFNDVCYFGEARSVALEHCRAELSAIINPPGSKLDRVTEMVVKEGLEADGDVDHHDEHAWQDPARQGNPPSAEPVPEIVKTYDTSHIKERQNEQAQEISEALAKDLYAELKAAAEAGKWMQHQGPDGRWCLPRQHMIFDDGPNHYRILTTIEHNGKTFFSHTPGDEMPCGEDAEVFILIEGPCPGWSGYSMPAQSGIWGKGVYSGSDILGWYPVALAEALGNVEKPAIPQLTPELAARGYEQYGFGAGITVVEEPPVPVEWVPLEAGDVPPGSYGTFYKLEFCDKPQPPEFFPLTVAKGGVWITHPSTGKTEFRDWFCFKQDCNWLPAGATKWQAARKPNEAQS